jgi:hypothetical protein
MGETTELKLIDLVLSKIDYQNNMGYVDRHNRYR